MKFPFNFHLSPFTFMLHIALTTILVGACVTHFFGVQGEIHLRADKAESLNLKYSSISLFLWDFQVVEDPQTHAPADYITELRLLDRSQSNRSKAGLTVKRSYRQSQSNNAVVMWFTTYLVSSPSSLCCSLISAYRIF